MDIIFAREMLPGMRDYQAPRSSISGGETWTESSGLRDTRSVIAEIPFDKPFDEVLGAWLSCINGIRRDAAQTVPLASPRWIRCVSGVRYQPGALLPAFPTFEQCLAWIAAAFTASGTDSRMGVKLDAAFLEAGLSPESP